MAISQAKIREALRRKGVLPTTAEDAAKVAKQAVAKMRLQNAIPEDSMAYLRHFQPMASYELRWKEFNPSVSDMLNLGRRPTAYAYINDNLILKITRNVSGKYKDRHYVSLHAFRDCRDASRSIVVDELPLVGMNFECHFTYGRAKVAEFADTTIRKYIKDYSL